MSTEGERKKEDDTGYERAEGNARDEGTMHGEKEEGAQLEVRDRLEKAKTKGHGKGRG